MKIINHFLLLLIFISSAAMAQESSFYDAPFGGGGGYIGGWMIPNINGVNSELKKIGMPDLNTGGFYTSGGAGFIYLGIVPGVRIGGIGFGGSRTNSSKYTIEFGPESFVGYSQTVYKMSAGALTIEYTLPFIKNIGVSVGAWIGRGSLEIDVYSNSGGLDWNSLLAPVSPGLNLSLKNTYWIFTPTLNVDIPAYRLLSFRIGTGYQLTFGSHWTYNNDKDIYNAPSDINGNSFFIQAGVFVGLFSF